MNWYKTIKLSTPRTLYHGTSINNYDSIKNVGLVPDTGNFVSDSYSGEYDAAGAEFETVDVTYAADKDSLQKAVNAMEYAVMKMLNKNWREVTSNELKNYGMLVIVKEGEDQFEHRPEKEEGPWKDWQGETNNQYPAVEPGDYFSEYEVGPIEILIGNKMESFLKRNGVWPINYREELLTMAIRYHVKEKPELKNKIIEEVKQKIMNLSDEKVQQYYQIYLEKINELV